MCYFLVYFFKHFHEFLFYFRQMSDLQNEIDRYSYVKEDDESTPPPPPPEPERDPSPPPLPPPLGKKCALKM